MRLKLLTLALSLAAVSLPSHGEDLLDAYHQARANDPVLAQADATRLASGEGVTQARAQFLPQIDGSLSLSQTTGGDGGRFQDPNNPGQFLSSSQIGHSRTRSLNANLSQTVFDFSKYASLKAAHASANAQDELYQAALQDLFVRVSSAYFGALTAEDQLAFAKANEDAYKQQFEQSNQRYKVGLSAITDVYQAKSYYEGAKAQTIAAQNALDNAREALSQITGKPVGSLKKLRDELPMNAPTPADPNAWVAKALADNPNLLAQKQNVAAAEHEVTVARSGHLPTITANVSYGRSASWYENAAIHSNMPGSTTVGLTLNVPIFSGGATQSRVRQSIYQRDAAQDSAEIERRQVKADTLNYYRSVLAGVSQVESGKAAVESAQKALDATRAGFEVGTQTMVNVLLAIQTLTQAESSYSQSRHQLVLNRLLLKQSAGSASLDDMNGINALLQ